MIETLVLGQNFPISAVAVLLKGTLYRQFRSTDRAKVLSSPYNQSQRGMKESEKVTPQLPTCEVDPLPELGSCLEVRIWQEEHAAGSEKAKAKS